MKNEKIKNMENELENENESWSKENPKIFTAYLWITDRKTGELISVEPKDFYLSDLKYQTGFNVSEELNYSINEEWYNGYSDVYDISHRYAIVEENDEDYNIKIINKEIINGKMKKRSYVKKFKKELLNIFP